MERNMINAASGGALVDKTPQEVRNLIATMAANSQQFGTCFEASMKANEVTTTISNVDQNISNITAFIK